MLVLALTMAHLLVPQAANATCSAGSGAVFSAGSAIVGNQVILCANSDSTAVSTWRGQTATRKTVAVVKPKVCPNITLTTAQIVSAALLGCKIFGPSNPPSETVVITPKVKQISAVSQQNDSAAFVPNEISISSSPTQAAVLQAILLTANAVEHERTALVLGRTAYVRFVPNKYVWLAESAQVGDHPIGIASFATSGQKQIAVTVWFEASYRFGLSNAWMPVGLVSKSATALVLVAEPAKPMTDKSQPRLVSGNCKERPSTYRC